LNSAFETTLKQRLTQGGASGAFFFFSKNETLIAKSCSLDELHVLRDNAKAYADYFEANPESYIGKVKDSQYISIDIMMMFLCLFFLFLSRSFRMIDLWYLSITILWNYIKFFRDE
jgi:hypothetical protein